MAWSSRFRAGSEPHRFGFGGEGLWASDNSGGSLLRIDPRDRRVVETIRVGTAPHHVAPVGGGAIVAVHGENAVVVAEQGGRVTRVAVGAGHHGIAAIRSPAG